MRLHSSQDSPDPAQPKVPPSEAPKPKPEKDSDVHPERRPGEPPLPNESDNIPGDENDPNLVEGND